MRRFGATFLEATLPKTLEATSARSTRPLEATPGRFWLAFGATGTSKTNEFPKENHDVHFCVFSAPNALSEPQKASQDVPKAPQDAPQGVSGAPKSLSEMLWKHPRASLRRPRSTQRRPQRPQELPKASQDALEAPKSLPKTSPKHPKSLPKTSPKHPRHSRESPELLQREVCAHAQTKQQTIPCSKPLGNEATKTLETTRRQDHKRSMLQSHCGTKQHSSCISSDGARGQ